MPIFTLDTNVPREKFPSDFMDTLLKILMETTEQPKGFFSFIIRPGIWMSFAGSEEPCGNVTLGGMTGDLIKEGKNLLNTQRIMGYLKESIGIRPDRIYIVFDEADGPNVGFGMKTVDMFPKQPPKPSNVKG